MGLLSEGKPLTWAETKEYVDLVKRTGVLQFISAYQRLKNRPRDELKWGDEVGDPLDNGITELKTICSDSPLHVD